MRLAYAGVAAVTFVLAAQACVDAAAPPSSKADGGASGHQVTGDPPGGSSSGGDASVPPIAPIIQPGPPAVQYVGRFDTRDPEGRRTGAPGARVLVRFSGTSLTATLTEKALFQGPSRYDVTVDDKLQPDPLVMTDGTKDYTLASGLAAGTHVVELWRRTENLVGITTFKAFSFGGGGELLPPPALRTHHIEFVGDSGTAGYGVECTSASDTFSGATENEHKSYSALVATALSADHSNVSYSGKGVSRNFDDGDGETMADLYPADAPRRCDEHMVVRLVDARPRVHRARHERLRRVERPTTARRRYVQGQVLRARGAHPREEPTRPHRVRRQLDDQRRLSGGLGELHEREHHAEGDRG
jgi:hypothetical protein